MKSRLVALLVSLLAVVATSHALAHEGAGGNLGLGAGIGSPTALSLEVAPVPWSALELALGRRNLDENHLYGHFVYKLDLVRVADGPSVAMPIYLGAGVFVDDRSDTTDWGARLPLGLNLDFKRNPVQLFAEAALEAVVVSDIDDHHPISVGGFGGLRVWL